MIEIGKYRGKWHENAQDIGGWEVSGVGILTGHYPDMYFKVTMETTLSGISEITAIKEAIKIGYKVSMIYVSLDGEFENIGRVKNRARKGGHDIPIADILRRRQRSFENLLKIIDIIPRVIIIDNTQLPQTILRKNKNIITYVSNDLPGWFASIFSNKITDYRLEASSKHVLGIIGDDNDCKKY